MTVHTRTLGQGLEVSAIGLGVMGPPQSYVAPLASGSVPVSNVSFEPGCRNNWHIHHGTGGGGDQVLLCTAGSGWYQAEGEAPSAWSRER